MLEQGYTPEQIASVLKYLGATSGGGVGDEDTVSGVLKWIVILIGVAVAGYFAVTLIQAGAGKKVARRM